MEVIKIGNILENSFKETLKSTFFVVVLDATYTIEVRAVPMVSDTEEAILIP